MTLIDFLMIKILTVLYLRQHLRIKDQNTHLRYYLKPYFLHYYTTNVYEICLVKACIY